MSASRCSWPTPKARLSRTPDASGVRPRSSGEHNASSLGARRALGDARRLQEPLPNSTSRSPGSARTTRTRRHHYVDRYAVIALEDPRVCNMVRNHLARAISDAGWSQFVNILEPKAESAGVRIYKIALHFASQLC